MLFLVVLVQATGKHIDFLARLTDLEQLLRSLAELFHQIFVVILFPEQFHFVFENDCSLLSFQEDSLLWKLSVDMLIKVYVQRPFVEVEEPHSQ